MHLAVALAAFAQGGNYQSSGGSRGVAGAKGGGGSSAGATDHKQIMKAGCVNFCHCMALSCLSSQTAYNSFVGSRDCNYASADPASAAVHLCMLSTSPM